MPGPRGGGDPPSGSGNGGGATGGTPGRGGRVAGAGPVGAVGEGPVDNRGRDDHRDDPHRPLAPGAGQRVNLEDPADQFGPPGDERRRSVRRLRGRGLQLGAPAIQRSGKGAFRAFFVVAPDGLCFMIGERVLDGSSMPASG